MELNIIVIRFRQNEPLGYCFVLNEQEKIIKDDLKREEKINQINKNQLVQYTNNLLLYDIEKFNYIRSKVLGMEEEADEDISESMDLTTEHNKSKKENTNSPSKKTRKESLSSKDSKKSKRQKKQK